MKRPSSLKELRSLIGCINWLRDFVPDASRLLEPLTSLLKGSSSTVLWDEKEEVTFQAILAVLKQEITLGYPVYSVLHTKPLELFSDASDFACGSILIQGKTILV